MSSNPDRHAIQKVIVLLAGSRTGSSFLFRALNARGYFLSPTGEDTPFFRRAGLGLYRGGDFSDVLECASPAQLDHVGRELLADVGLRQFDGYSADALTDAYLRRFELQFPTLATPDREALRRKMEQEPYDYLTWVGENGGDANLFRTDAPPPQNLPLIEEPPYIVPYPQLSLSESAVAEIPLLLKTSTNLYRLPVLRALFPNAHFKFIVLQRNPAATISALIDGWLSSGFHAHHMPALRLKNYSEPYWKFDLPPGGLALNGKTLAEVCAYQWRCAHERLRDFHAPDMHRVRYEDLPAAIDDVLDFCNVGKRPETFDTSEAVVSVEAPRAGKWRKRQSEIEAVLPPLMNLAAQLGYESPETWP